LEETTGRRQKLQRPVCGDAAAEKKVPKLALWHKSCRIAPASAHEKEAGMEHPRKVKTRSGVAKDAARLAALPFLRGVPANLMFP